MITFFTTTKDFEGVNTNNQLNAINSWLNSEYTDRVIIFGKSKNSHLLPPNKKLILLDQVQISETGAPHANEMFDTALHYSDSPLLCYVNADIIITSTFYKALNIVYKKFQNNFLLVGQRSDFNVSGLLEFNQNWESTFLNDYKNDFIHHRPVGSDYFVFPANQYEKNKIPKLYIGRAGWDLWMIYEARRRNYSVVDLSPFTHVYHQNHDYLHKSQSYKSIWEEPEVIVNCSYIEKEKLLDFSLYACNLFLDADGKIKKAYSRGEKERFIRISRYLGIDSWRIPILYYWNKFSSAILK